MKNTIKTIIIISLVLLVSCGSAKNNTNNNTTEAVNLQKGNIAKNVNVADFQKQITNEGVILDVRTPGEYVTGHIEDAKNINFYDKNFMADVAKLDKTKPVYIYCKSGGRSGKAMNKMNAAGFKVVYNLSGGFSGWTKNGMPSVK